jgi:hypothetical protein
VTAARGRKYADAHDVESEGSTTEVRRAVPRARVRIPLQVGDAAARALAVGAALVGPSFFAFVFFPVLVEPIASGAGPGTGSVLLVGLGSAAGVAMLLGLRQLAGIRALRPSDLVVTAEGLTFEGGSLDGFALGWHEVEPDRWEVRTERGRQKLYAGGGAGDDATGGELLLAETTNSDEALGFVLTVDAVCAMCARAMGKAVRVEATAGRGMLFFCPGCGAECAPADVDTVPCGHCGAHAHVPAEIRERLRAALTAREDDAKTDHAIDTVLDQRSAHAAGRAMAASAGAMVLSWLVAVALLYLHLFRSGALHFTDVASAIGLCIAIGLGVSCVAVAVTSERRALHVVMLGLGAIPPARGDGSWGCRRCGAPLASSDTAVIPCQYCGAHNVVGVEVAGTLGAGDQDGQLSLALEERRERRIGAALLAFCGVAVLAVSAVSALLAR